MKKIIYIILLTVSSAFAMTACTDESITPANSAEKPSSGGGGSTGQI